MRKHMEQYDKLREQVIANSRVLLKSSKAAIYAAHRADLKGAADLLEKSKATIVVIGKLAKKDAHLPATGAYMDALEEYAEASCYLHYLKTGKVPTPKQIGVPPEVYLPGLSDLVGELVRKAVNSAAKGEYKVSLEIKEVVTQIYEELMLFDWRNTPARKKFDAIKYGLEKLEDLSLKIAFKAK